MQSDRYYSNPTQVYWRTKALLNGRKISHKTEIREVNGWRLGAIIHVLRKKIRLAYFGRIPWPEKHCLLSPCARH